MKCLASAILCVFVLAGCGERARVESVRWQVMGTVAAVSFKGAVLPALSEDVRKVYAQMENRLSAHNPDSEASRFRSLDEVVPETRACYKAAFNICEQSGGAFNPFWRGRDKGIDLGAIAKGFAVDVAAAKIDATVYSEGLLLDLGGNLKVVSGTWTTGIRDPDNPDGIIEKIILTNGMACATSGEYVRGKHIYDGRTGKPVDNNVLSVTVVHPTSAMLADGLSTTLFVLGREEGDAFLRRFYPEARAVWVMQNAVTK